MKFDRNLFHSESLHIPAVTKRDMLILYTYVEASRAHKAARHGAVNYCRLMAHVSAYISRVV